MTIGHFERLLRKLDISFRLAKTGLETKDDDDRLITILFRIFDPENDGKIKLDEFV
jgi:Ca2+-binding EF-hand superfamily protein